jgi:hypothetical protein
MNIFVLDNNPEVCATYHCDKHVVKMILESVQMMSTVLRDQGVDAGYRATHRNHPCTLWLKESLGNWNWLKALVVALNKEYRYRYGKKVNHKSYDLMMSLPTPEYLVESRTEFVLAMPDECRIGTPVHSYREYYRKYKVDICTWKNREVPQFMFD